MGDLATLLPAAGAVAVFGLVIGYLIQGNRADRVDYRAALAEARRQLDEERDEREQVEQQLDEERAARRRAEDDAARSVRAAERAADELAQLGRQVQHLEAEVKRLRELLGSQHG